MKKIIIALLLSGFVFTSVGFSKEKTIPEGEVATCYKNVPFYLYTPGVMAGALLSAGTVLTFLKEKLDLEIILFAKARGYGVGDKLHHDPYEKTKAGADTVLSIVNALVDGKRETSCEKAAELAGVSLDTLLRENKAIEQRKHLQRFNDSINDKPEALLN